MGAPSGLGEALLFGLVCFIFICPAAWLFLQTVQGDMESRQAILVYLPLLFCWIGIGETLHTYPALAGAFFILAAAWCVMAAVRVIAVNERIKRDLRVSEIEHSRAWLMQHPNDGIGHFRLADLFEQHGLLNEAYTEYVAVATLDPHNKHAVIRARDVYRELTKKPSASNANLPSPPEMPSEKPPVPPAAKEQPGRISEFMGALERDPSNATLHASLADELLRHGRAQEAAEAYRKALWLDPSNERYRFNYHSLLEPSPDINSPAPEIGPAPVYEDPPHSAAPVEQGETTQRVEPHTELFRSPLTLDPVVEPPPAPNLESKPEAGTDSIPVPPQLNFFGEDDDRNKPAPSGPGG